MKSILIIFLLILNVNVQAQLQPATQGIFIQGINYSYYEGSYIAMPKFSILTTTKTDTAGNFNAVPSRPENYAVSYNGFFNAATSDSYTFYVASDDGSLLYIDNILVVNNDGLHGMVERQGVIGLQAGKHSINLQHFNATGDVGLQVRYSNLTTLKKLIANSELFRTAPVVVIPLPTGDALQIIALKRSDSTQQLRIVNLEKKDSVYRKLYIEQTGVLKFIKGTGDTDTLRIIQ